VSPRPLPSEDATFEPALALARAGRTAEALAALATLARDQGDAGRRGDAGALALAQVAHLAEAAGDGETALRALDEALRLRPAFADLHYRRGCLLLDGPRGTDARAALELAVSIHPGYLAARLELALLDAREGFLADALASLRAMAAEPRVKSPGAFQRGLKSLERADWDEAAALLRSAIRAPAPAVDRAMERHRELLGRGDPAGALATLREAITTHPGYPDLHAVLGTCELEAGLLDDALASLARALELNPDFHGARVQLARVLEALGDLEQARGQVALVLEADPAHPQARELEARWTRRREAGGEPAPPARNAPARKAS